MRVVYPGKLGHLGNIKLNEYLFTFYSFSYTILLHKGGYTINIWSKMDKFGHMMTESDDCRWEVLKAYKSRKSEKSDPYARWLCRVMTPMCPDGELGDVYVKDVFIDEYAKDVLERREMIESQDWVEFPLERSVR